MKLRVSYYHQIHGHIVDVLPTGQFYRDDGSPVDWENLRPCISCGASFGKDAHDSCIANLPGARNACCGHGLVQEGIPPLLLGTVEIEGQNVDIYRPGQTSRWGYVDLLDGRRLEFQGDCGGERIRAAVNAALNDMPIPEGFAFRGEVHVY